MQAKRPGEGEIHLVSLPSEPVDRSQPSKAVDTTYSIIGWLLQGGVIPSAISSCPPPLDLQDRRGTPSGSQK